MLVGCHAGCHGRRLGDAWLVRRRLIAACLLAAPSGPLLGLICCAPQVCAPAPPARLLAGRWLQEPAAAGLPPECSQVDGLSVLCFTQAGCAAAGSGAAMFSEIAPETRPASIAAGAAALSLPALLLNH